MTRSSYRNYRLAGLLALLCLSLWVHFPVLQNGFTNWDEEEVVVKNPLVIDFSTNSIIQAFTSFSSNQYFPLPIVTHSLIHHLFGMEPFFFHLADLTLHLGCVFMVFLFLSRLTLNLRVSLVAAFIFSLHPLQVQSFAWIIQLRLLMFTLFFFASLTCYVGFARRGSKAPLAAAFLFMLLSALCKSLAITLPVMFLLIDFRLRRPFALSRFAEKIPFFLLAIFIFVVAARGANLGAIQDPLLERILMSSYSMLFYLPKLLVPIQLCCLHLYPPKTGDSYSLLVTLSPMLVLVLLGVSILWLKASRKPFFGAWFYLCNIFPVSRFFPVGAPFIAMEQFVYVPIVGLLLLFSESLFWAFKKSRCLGKCAINIFLVMMLVGFSLLSRERIAVWENSVTLFEDVLVKYPQTPFPYNQLGLHYLFQGNPEAALKIFSLMAGRFPGDSRPWYMQAKVHISVGNLDAALLALDRAQALSGPTPTILMHRATIQLLRQNYPEAIQELNQALADNSREWSGYLNRAWAHFLSGNEDQAFRDTDQALALTAEPAGPLVARGLFSLLSGRFFRGLADLKRAETISGVHFPGYLGRVGQNLRSFGGEGVFWRSLVCGGFQRCPGLAAWLHHD